MRTFLSAVAFRLYGSLTPNARTRLKALLGVNGHLSNSLDFLRSTRDGAGKKRLDRSLARICEALRFAGLGSLEGRRCLEIGCGFAPSESLSMILLGAEKVYATDLNRIADLEALKIAFDRADKDTLLNMLVDFGVPGGLARERFDGVQNALANGWSALEALGLHYRAPVTLESETYQRDTFDFIYSVSVLEHIKPTEVRNSIERVFAATAKDGVWVNEIDLRDHFDFSDPQGFIYDETYDAESQADTRGNRLRRDDWLSIFRELTSSNTEVVAEVVANGPVDRVRLAAALSGKSDKDLLCENLVLTTRRVNE
jgi:hypothetical protein